MAGSAGIVIGADTSGAIHSVKNLTKALDDLGAQGIVTESEIKKITAEAKKKFAAEEAAREAQKLGATLQNVAKACGMSAKELENLRVKAGLTAKEMSQASASMSGMSAGAVALGGAIAGAFSVSAIVDMARAIGETKLQFENLERAMKAITGTNAGAAAAMQYVGDISDKLGVRLTSAADGYKTIAAAAKGTTLEGAGAKAAFESVAEAAAALGLSSDQANGALLALGQMISKGKVQAEELRGQLGERLPGAFQIAARGMNMTTAELDEMMSKGALITNDFLPKFAAELHKTYGQAAVEAGNSGQASFNKLANSWDQLKLALADTGAWSVALSFVGNLTAGINRMSAATREATGVLQGLQKIQSVEAKIQQAKNNIGMAEAGRGVFSGLDDMGILESQKEYIARQNNEIIRLEQEGATERQKVSEQTRRDYAKRSLNQINKQADDEASAVKTGQKETMKAWEGSSDKKVSLWAKSLSDTSEAWQKAYKGEITHGAMENIIEQANQKYSDGLDAIDKKGKKAGENAANAAAKYGESASSFYGNVARSIAQMEDSLTGGTEKNGMRVDDWFKDQFAKISEVTKGAKGDVEAYKQAWVLLEQMWPGIKMLAVTKDLSAELKKQSQLLKDIADATGDPAMSAKASVYEADSWYAEKKQLIESTYKDESEKAAMMAALQDGYNAKLLKGRAEAYEGVAAVSSKYWEAEKKLLAEKLAGVKKEAQDELAFKIYAAQQEDDLLKRQLESQAATAGSFAETLSAKWSLAFGGYKSETTKTKESWDQMADSIVTASNGMVDGVAGGFGDMIRNIGNGTSSIEDLWKNMLSRMLDMFASFVEDLIKSQLKDMVGGMLSGGTSGSSLSSLFGGGSSSAGTSTKDLVATGKGIGKGIFSEFTSGGTEASTFVKSMGESSAQSVKNAFTDGSGNVSGWTFGDGSSVGGKTGSSMGSTLTGGMAAIGGIAQMANSTSTMGTIGGGMMTAGGVMMMIPSGVTQVIGGIMMAGGALLSAFGSEKKEEKKKTASGYTINYAGGKTTSTGIDFYSDGSTVGTGPNDPDVTKKISDSFKEAAENLSDFADALGFTVDVLDSFQMPSMNITSDQLDGYIRNGTNAMAFQALEQAGLRGAFDQLAEDGEVYIDEVERLATAYSTGASKLSAYGYDMADVAQVTTAQIDALRAQTVETAAGTAQATLLMAESMGATSAQLAELAANASDGSQALSVTDEQLSNLLEADWVSKVEDAVGGEDAFNAIMDTLLGNVFDNIGAYAENLDYYNTKAQTAIAKLGDSSVTVDNFWDKFNESLKEGMDPDTFELWSKASTWVNSIDTVNDALEQWNTGMKQLNQSLDARLETAQGYTYQAAVTKQLAAAEKELYDAREAGYDAAYLARLQTVQAAEMAATAAQHQEDYANAVIAAQDRVAAVTGDHTQKLRSTMAKNEAEYRDYEKEFTHAPGHDDSLFRALEAAYAAEIVQMLQDWSDAVTKANSALTQDIAARRASLEGLDAQAEAMSKVAAFQQELNDAYDNGVSKDLIDQLSQLQLDELADYWKDTINELNKELGAVGETLEDRLTDILDRFTDYTSGQLSMAQTSLSVAQQAAGAYKSAASSIEDAMDSIRKDNAISDPKQLYADALADWQTNYAKAMTGDTTALNDSAGLAQELMTALAEYTPDSGLYEDIYASVLSQLGELDTISTSMGIAGDYQVTLLEAQVELLTGINNELAQTSPDEAALQNMVSGLGVVSDLLAGTRNVYVTDDATAAPLYSVINDLTGQTVQIGDLSLAQLADLKDYTAANVDATGEVANATLQSNTFLETQQGLLLSGNATQDILRSFSAQNITVSQEIKNAIMGDSATANSYLANVQTATTQMVTLLADFLDINQEQYEAQQLLVKQAQVAAAQSAAQTLYNQAVSSVQSTTVGSLTSGMATTGRGWAAGLGDATGYSDAFGMTYLQAIQTGQEGASVAGFVNWYLNAGYGTGSGYVDWAAAMSLMQSLGLLPSDTASLLEQYQSKQQEYLALKAQYGFATGGVVPGASYAGDSVIAGLNSGERVLTADQNRTFERMVFGGGSDDLVAEVKALRQENAEMRREMGQYLFSIATTNGNVSRKADDWNRRGMPTRDAEV